jgi:AraC-like DNA-binding protein
MLSPSFDPFHRYSILRSRQLPGVEIVRGYHSGPPAGWRFVPMVQVTLLKAGSAMIWSRGKTIRLDPGDVVVNAPNCSRRVVERLTPTSRTVTAFIAPAVFEQHAFAQGRPVAAVELGPSVVKNLRIGAQLEALVRGIEGKARRAALQGALAELVVATIRATHRPVAQRANAGPVRPEIDDVRRILAERFDQQVTLDELRSKVGLSKFHLLRLFREEFGSPPHAYQLQLRISHAREMLREKAAPVDVALRCGFADQAHFTRCFKRIVGYSPAAFARLR